MFGISATLVMYHHDLRTSSTAVIDKCTNWC